MTDEPFTGLPLQLAGQVIADGWDRLRRYCGLQWSGGPPETWAYRYYDIVESDGDEVTSVDVLAAAALHPGISRDDLTYFWDHRAELSDWVSTFPPDLVLRDADDEMVDRLAMLARWEHAPSLSLLTKVLHRKRPGLIPLLDREVIDYYRPITGERGAVAAWPELLRAMRNDLSGNGENTLYLAIMNGLLIQDLGMELGQSLSQIRLIDIVIWMGGRNQKTVMR